MSRMNPPGGWLHPPRERTESAEVPANLPRCRVCGCWDGDACINHEGACHWVERTLCSACAEESREDGAV